MSIAEEIGRIGAAKDALKTSIENKGVSVPTGAKLHEYPQLVDAIDTSEYARPVDWIPLPDIENETRQKIVMLLHISQQGATDFGFYVTPDSDFTAISKIAVDWGDGTTDECTDESQDEPGTFYGEIYAYHKYDYETLDAPITTDGEKQVIVTVCVPEDSNIQVGNFYIRRDTYADNGNGAQKWLNLGLLKEIAMCSPTIENSSITIEYCPSLFAVYCYNVYQITISSNATKCIKKLVARGENFKRLSLANAGNVMLDIPKENQYEYLNFSNSYVRELLFYDLSKVSGAVNLINTYGSLKRLVATGITKAINLDSNGLGRDAFIELFQSLGAAPEGSTPSIRLRYSPGTEDLTDADKAIATQKGWTLTL